MRPCILIVDDEQGIRKLIIKSLVERGNKREILQAGDPQEAFDHFVQNKDRIDVIICDQYMPIQNGEDFCAIVKRDHPKIKIYIFTGDKRLHRTAKSLNVDVVYYKPDDLETLIENILEMPLK